MYPVYFKKDFAKRFHHSSFVIRYSAVLRFAFNVSYKRRRWPRASSQIEKETLKKRITNIEQGIMNVEVRYSIDLY
jgi:hypothetical protein